MEFSKTEITNALRILTHTYEKGTILEMLGGDLVEVTMPNVNPSFVGRTQDVLEGTIDNHKVVRKELVNILHKHSMSLQFNCFHGVFEIVEQDMKLDIVLSEARDRRGKFDKIQPKG